MPAIPTFTDFYNLPDIDGRAFRLGQHMFDPRKVLSDQEGNIRSGRAVLEISGQASKAASIINARCYPGLKLRDSAPSFTKDYERPFTVHHRERDSLVSQAVDPIGRIKGAEFLSYVDEGVLSKDFLNPTKEGSGELRYRAQITDPDAIPKVMDGRYKTISIDFSSPELWCSICKKDWIAGSACEHEPLRFYAPKDSKDSVTSRKLAYLITGEHIYNAISFVNRPACSTAGVSDMKFLTDAVERAMNDLPKEIDWVLQPNSYFMVDSLTVGEVKYETMDPKDREVIEVKDPCPECPVEDEKKDEIEVSDEIAYAEVLQSLVQADLLDYESLEKEDGISPEQVDEILSTLEDAELSTESRNKLPESSFCASGRAFPANDCCLRGTTRIRLLCGNTPTILEVLEMLSLGEEVWTYGFDLKTKTVVPAQITKAWKARENAEILKIVLDTGEEIFCTDNHPFLMRDMSYKIAGELKSGDSLMPLYTKVTSHGTRGYEKIRQPWYGYWEYTHRMVARVSLGGLPEDSSILVHHQDENPRNNTPQNLQHMSREEHAKHHSYGRRGRTRHNPPSAEELKVRSGQMKLRMKRISEDQNLREKHASSLSKGRRTLNWDQPEVLINTTEFSLIDVFSALRIGASYKFLSNVLGVESPTLRHWIRKSRLRNIENFSDTEAGKRLGKAFFVSEFGSNIEDIYSDFCKGIKRVALHKKYRIDRSTITTWFKKLGLCYSQTGAILQANGLSVEEVHRRYTLGECSMCQMEKDMGLGVGALRREFNRLGKGQPNNHKVLSVSQLEETEDVYDIEVPATSNFALDVGIFVHNSHVRAGFRLLNRAKVSDATRTRIRACLTRKNKSMSCGVKMADSTETKIDHTAELQVLIDQLTAEKGTLVQEKTALETKCSSLVEENTRLADQVKGHLAETLLDLRVKTGHPTVKDLKDDSRVDILKSLKDRSKASLEDAIADERLREKTMTDSVPVQARGTISPKDAGVSSDTGRDDQRTKEVKIDPYGYRQSFLNRLKK